MNLPTLTVAKLPGLCGFLPIFPESGWCATWAKGGYVYHVLNRAVGRATLFAKATDYEAFVRVLAEALDWVNTGLLAYCVLPNHWHLVVWPERDGDLSEFMR
jgi:putative transposase